MHRPIIPLLVALLALPAIAYAQAQMQTPLSDCQLARDPTRCTARQQAQIQCKKLHGHARQQCLLDHLPAPDCSKAEDPQHCTTRQHARSACRDKRGKELRACLSTYSLRY